MQAETIPRGQNFPPVEMDKDFALIVLNLVILTSTSDESSCGQAPD